jgi:hypothetical protein
VDWAVGAVEVEPVERQVGDDPFRDLAHVFVLDEEIAGRAAAFANECASGTAFAGSMLIKFRRNTALDVPREFDR